MFDSIACVEGLIGITLKTKEVFLVNIKEDLDLQSIMDSVESTSHNPVPVAFHKNESTVEIDDDSSQESTQSPRKRRKRRSSGGSNSTSTPVKFSRTPESSSANRTHTQTESSNEPPPPVLVLDAVDIKAEPDEHIAMLQGLASSSASTSQPPGEPNYQFDPASFTSSPASSHLQSFAQASTSSVPPGYHSNIPDQALEQMESGGSESLVWTAAYQNNTKSGDPKKYQCNICFNSYAIPTSLSRHMRIHRENALKCLHCGKIYQQRKHLNTHIKTCPHRS